MKSTSKKKKNTVSIISFAITFVALLVASVFIIHYSSVSRAGQQTVEPGQSAPAVFLPAEPTVEELEKVLEHVQPTADDTDAGPVKDLYDPDAEYHVTIDNYLIPRYDISRFVNLADLSSHYSVQSGTKEISLETIRSWSSDPVLSGCVAGNYSCADITCKYYLNSEFAIDVSSVESYVKQIRHCDNEDVLFETFESSSRHLQKKFVNGAFDFGASFAVFKDPYTASIKFFDSVQDNAFLKNASVLDYGLYDGRDAVRVAGSAPAYITEKNEITRFEKIYDLETGCALQFIGYDRNGRIVAFESFSDLTFANSIEIPWR